MTPLNLDGHQNTHVDLDLCPSCQVIWFDQYESLRLEPSAVLQLFKLIGDRGTAAPKPLPATMWCPRCRARLAMTNDRMRNTPFRYFRCPKEHGRLTTFFDFLREKDFIRPLTPPQIEQLRASVQQVNCSNCGAPIDLVNDSICRHCGTPLSMIDLPQIQRMTAQLAQTVELGKQPVTVDPALLMMQLASEHHHIEMLSLGRSATRDTGVDLIAHGVGLIASWLL